jgi:hypothetical protein
MVQKVSFLSSLGFFVVVKLTGSGTQKLKLGAAEDVVDGLLSVLDVIVVFT